MLENFRAQVLKVAVDLHDHLTVNLSFSPQDIMAHILQKATKTFTNNG